VATGKATPGLQIDQIFLVKAEFGHREDFLSLPPNSPIGEINLNVQAKLRLKSDRSAAALLIGVRTNPPDNSLYSLDVEMMALIRAVEPEPAIPPLEYAATAGVSALYPFLREVVANLTMRGRFGPIWLKPVNVRKMTADLLQKISTGEGSHKEQTRKVRATKRSKRLAP